jgi:hypothetical protein
MCCEDKVSIFNLWNKSLHDFLELEPLTILIIHHIQFNRPMSTDILSISLNVLKFHTKMNCCHCQGSNWGLKNTSLFI